MTKYLISFPSFAMDVSDDELPAVAEAAHDVIRDAQRAGVYVFGGGINEGVGVVTVAEDGGVRDGGYDDAEVPNGGYTVLELPTRQDAVEWAARIARACRCPQELREFQFDPVA
ncbi:YciI family protein [Microbacterium aureliae]